MSPQNPTLRALLEMWRNARKASARPTFDGFCNQDLALFNTVLKDSVILEAEENGPFRFAFLGSEMEDYLGRNLQDSVFENSHVRQLTDGFTFPPGDIADRGRPALSQLNLRCANSQDTVAVELLCLPLEGNTQGVSALLCTVLPEGRNSMPHGLGAVVSIEGRSGFVESNGEAVNPQACE